MKTVASALEAGRGSYGYFITTIAIEKENGYYKAKNEDPNDKIIGMRTPGWAGSFKKAYDWVVNNAADIYEYCYDYALIERIHSGIYPHAVERWWFKWNPDKKGYELINHSVYDVDCDEKTMTTNDFTPEGMVKDFRYYTNYADIG